MMDMEIEIPVSQPVTKAAAIQARARLYREIRQFFTDRDVLEVEIPLLSAQATAQALQVTAQQQSFYLQTSPLLVLQPLLATLGSMYQIGKVFRDEQDRKHAIEFSVLSWCRPQFNLLQLMQEVSDLLSQIFVTLIEPKIISYSQAFMHRLDINPLTADLAELKDTARRVGLNENLGNEPSVWLDWLFSHFVEPTLGMEYPVYLTDFPPVLQPQAVVHQNAEGHMVAHCFELYMDGLAVANAYQFDRDAAGISLGLDRLLMVLLNTRRIDKV